ncbi:ATP-binding protein [Inquilinus limosus]|uniref:Transcriptional regulator n=1 Tax=Inquilinus limosus TaxID=171674 RepID=A0A211ZN42_9PROT|nr:winged helix-turn-helix domain-containing protein [Inquilinus limosus]OWJ66681.1 transcriptional regulator [Inquilinus limosus]
MAIEVGKNSAVLLFGPFKLSVGERLLIRESLPVEMGGRALDLLIALVTRPNHTISKKELMEEVWPNVLVEDVTLRFHMASLRKALGDGQDGARYISTVVGRGYCFVAPVARTVGDHGNVPARTLHFPEASLPPRLDRMIGRDEEVLTLSTQLTESRFVTIVGPGGVGKTTMAIAAAHQVAEEFAGQVLFVDFGVINDLGLAATTVASLLGLSVQTEDATPDLARFLKDKRLLLVLDTCEHLIEAIARMVAAILNAAPQVHVLATSREALRIEGEHIYRLEPLACPPAAPAVALSAIRQFPATQLFIERAVAGGARLNISAADAAIVCDICRRLDGVALAIELAARRVETYGLEQTAALLDQRLTLLWQGLRTAPPRQQTLQATLDWSFGLLTDLERLVLRRLAIFVGYFTLDAALEVVTNDRLDTPAVFAAIDSLVEKSMVAARPLGAMMRYRLLDTTRSYAVDLSSDEAMRTELATRHARYFRRWLEQNGTEWSALTTGAERAPHFAALNNVRAALEWCFGATGDPQVGIGLAAAAAPVFRAMGLVPECHRWTERALCTLDATSRRGKEEMHLQASRGVSLMFTQGHSEATFSALNRSLEIAEARGDYINAARLLGPIFFCHLRSGQYLECLRCAQRCSEFAQTLDDPVAISLSHTLLGVAYLSLGRLSDARSELESVLAPGNAAASRQVHFGFDHHTWARISWITTLWLQGYPTEARAAIQTAFSDAEAIRHPVSLAVVLSSIATILWIGDLDFAQELLDWFISRVERQEFAPYLHMGNAFKAELAIRRGDVEAGVAALRRHIQALHIARFEIYTVRFQMVLASGLVSEGRFAEAFDLMNEAEREIEETRFQYYLPELLRLKGSILVSAPELNSVDAGAYFAQSLEISRCQGSRVWELRAATDLASLWAGQGRSAEAHALLRPVVEQFTEAGGTPDLEAALDVLARIGEPVQPGAAGQGADVRARRVGAE